jgi:hypothetical protein
MAVAVTYGRIIKARRVFEYAKYQEDRLDRTPLSVFGRIMWTCRGPARGRGFHDGNAPWSVLASDAET